MVSLHEVNIDSPIVIMGHTFNGLAGINRAVGAYSRIITSFYGKRYVSYRDPEEPVPGIHILKLYEGYPCFDEDDYADEKREYVNFFFSGKPFTQEEIERLASLPSMSNCRLVTEGTPTDALPAVYYSGNGNKMIVATQKKSDER